MSATKKELEQHFFSIENFEELKVEGKINLYLLRHVYNTKSTEDNYSVNMPGNLNSTILKKILSNLNKYKDKTCNFFDPTNQDKNAIEYLPVSEIQSNWAELRKLMKENPYNFKGNEIKIQNTNLSIIELLLNNNKYYLISKQKTSISLFKDKSFFLSKTDKLEEIPVDNLFSLNFNIDCIIDMNMKNPYVLILNESNFLSIFNYEEHIKQFAMDNKRIIDTWNFLDSTDIIYKKIENKNVYKNLYKIFSDEAYLSEIKQVSAKILKNRLLSRASQNFTESDFKGDKLSITNNNINKIMKMLGKGFKYNFFTDNAEDL